MDFRSTTVPEIAELVRQGNMSAREVTSAALAKIDQMDPNVHAFVALDHDRSLEQAAAIDQIVASGGDPGPLAGVPLAVKDLEDAAGYRTTYGSVLHAEDEVAKHDSPHVARLRSAGCVIVGKTNTPEFGFAAKTDNGLFGATRNPWNLECSPGGSSGGSAAALACGMVPLATGSDGGGSIRIPASCCGLSGMKTSLGRVPIGGEKPPGWPDLSVRGPMARRIADVIYALDVVVGPEQSDLRSLPRPEASWPAVLNNPRVPSKVAWSATLGYASVDDDVLRVCEKALTILESLGVEIVSIDTVFDSDPVMDWLTLTAVLTLRTIEPLIEGKGLDAIDPQLAFLCEYARSRSGLDVVGAMDAAHRLNLRLVELFHDVRLLVTPTLAAPPPPIALDGGGVINGETTQNWVSFTYPFNMTRSPAATVCAGLTPNGLPIGIQLVGPQHADLVVLRSAAALEAGLGFQTVPPHT